MDLTMFTVVAFPIHPLTTETREPLRIDCHTEGYAIDLMNKMVAAFPEGIDDIYVTESRPAVSLSKCTCTNVICEYHRFINKRAAVDRSFENLTTDGPVELNDMYCSAEWPHIRSYNGPLIPMSDFH